MREHLRRQRRRKLWGCLLSSVLFLLVGSAHGQAPSKPSPQALQSQLRGVTQMVLQLRRDMAKMKREHAASIKALKQQHARTLRRLRTLGKSGAQAPAKNQGMAALQRRVKVLSHQVEGLRQQVRRYRRHIGNRSGRSGQRFIRPPVARGTRPQVIRRRGLQISGREYAKGFYMLTFQLGYVPRRIEYKLSHMRSWRSTGMTHVRNPRTGQPYPQMYIMTRHMKQGKNAVGVRLQRPNGSWTKARIYTVTILPKANSDADLFLRYQWSNPIMRQVRYRRFRNELWFMFFWASNPKIFKRASYSFGSPSLHNHFIKNGKKKKGSIIRRHMTPGRYTLYARFQLVNGTFGPLLTYQIDVKANKRWYNAHP